MNFFTKKFTRKKEDFVCEHCGFFVEGNGYTNHCPKCLWSKHVDVNPGDRASVCGGMMEPVAVELSKGEYVIHQACTKCGHRRTNRSSEQDDTDALIALSGNPIP